jgi:hypothetical protein
MKDIFLVGVEIGPPATRLKKEFRATDFGIGTQEPEVRTEV